MLTAKFIASLKAAASGQRAHYWDALVSSFGVRVTERGTKTFIVYRRWPGSRAPARRTIGDVKSVTLAEARDKAREWITLAERGIDPAEQQRKAKIEEQRRRQAMFKAVVEAWLASDEVKKTRTAHSVAREMRAEFVAIWGDWPLTDVTAADVAAVIRAKAATAPGQARNLLGHLKRFFGWAQAQHSYGLEASPVVALKPERLVGKKAIRKRVLSDDELRALWQATDAIDYPFGPLVRLLMLTGQRRSDVSKARWREFDLGKRLWSIPAERYKTDSPHIVPLSDDAIAILEALPRFKSGDYMFTTTFGVRPFSGFSKLKARLDKLMEGKAAGPWILHDIRRTVRTQLSALPVADNVRELVIGHAQPGLHQVYDQHAYIDEKRRALELWAMRLRDIVATTASRCIAHAQEGVNHEAQDQAATRTKAAGLRARHNLRRDSRGRVRRMVHHRVPKR
jgi:integrase